MGIRAALVVLVLAVLAFLVAVAVFWLALNAAVQATP
jgi:hypothetical protein